MNTILKLLTYYYALIAFYKRKVMLTTIGRDDLVLDVGSGDKPFWRADVMVDNDLEDNQQRFSGSMLYDKRKLFLSADVEKLPFRDKVFDFVFCSHLLEHVNNPEKALKEMQRVAKKGYIEVPRSILDALAPFPPHLWFCDLDNDTLIFRRKSKNNDPYLKIIENFGSKFFYNPIIQYLFIKNFNEAFICFYWDTTIKYKIIKSSGPEYHYTYKKELKHNKSNIVKLNNIFYKIYYLIVTTLFYKPKDLSSAKLLK